MTVFEFLNKPFPFLLFFSVCGSFQKWVKITDNCVYCICDFKYSAYILLLNHV